MTERAREAAGPRIIFLKPPPLSHTLPGKGSSPGSGPLHSLQETGFRLHRQEPSLDSQSSSGPQVASARCRSWKGGWRSSARCLPGAPSQLWGSEVHFSGVKPGWASRLPRQSPSGRKTRRAAPRGPLHPHTENFVFVLSQEAHASLVYRERRVGRPTGKLLSSSAPGGWVSTAEREGDVRLTQRCPGRPKSHRGMARGGW